MKKMEKCNSCHAPTKCEDRNKCIAGKVQGVSDVLTKQPERMSVLTTGGVSYTQPEPVVVKAKKAVKKVTKKAGK